MLSKYEEIDGYHTVRFLMGSLYFQWWWYMDECGEWRVGEHVRLLDNNYTAEEFERKERLYV